MLNLVNKQEIPKKPELNCHHCSQAFEYTFTDDVEKAFKASKVMGLTPLLFWSKVSHELCDQKANKEKELQQERADFEAGEYYKKQCYNIPFLPDLVQSKTFDNYAPHADDAQSVSLARVWQPQDPFGVFFMGSPGSGKTHLMLALFNKALTNKQFLKERQGIAWFPVALGLDKIRTEMQKDDDRFKKSALTAQYLFLDDLGVENPTEWGREQLYIILDYRLSQHLPTFISTNLTVDEVRARYHERFLSRIKENSLVIQLKGTDHRTSNMKNIVSILKARTEV